MTTKFSTLIGLLLLTILLVPADGRSAGDETRLNVFVDCHCADPVGQTFCADFKTKVKASSAYRLVDHADAYGIGVHFWSVDLWNGLPGIDHDLAGTMSAVSVAFTIYAEQLPGEVYVDSSVFRVGKDAADEMSERIVAAIGQLATANKSAFENIRANRLASPTAAPTPRVIQ